MPTFLPSHPLTFLVFKIFVLIRVYARFFYSLSSFLFPISELSDSFADFNGHTKDDIRR
jgi:hypothetical protein